MLCFYKSLEKLKFYAAYLRCSVYANTSFLVGASILEIAHAFNKDKVIIKNRLPSFSFINDLLDKRFSQKFLVRAPLF